MTIRVLPEALASRIAAGEVIERPASAAKELVENALDAKATRICVTCVAGGKERLVVEDNGSGMSAEELALSVLRHATSKIETLEDLERIETLGFRGEALASLAAVSELEIRSRTRDASQGSMIRIRGNEAEPVLPISSDFGTRIQADHLFYNLPARRKFLKTSLSEFRKCHGVVTNYAMAYPEVEFLLTNEGKTSFHSKVGGDRKKVLECVWGRGDIRSASFEYGSVSVEAWFRPEPERSRMQLLAYVNGRLFFDPVIRAAISRVCHDPSGQWAFFLRLAPENVDVNIHPAKTEVRFLVPGDVFEAVRSSVALQLEEPVAFKIQFLPSLIENGLDERRERLAHAVGLHKRCLVDGRQRGHGVGHIIADATRTQLVQHSQGLIVVAKMASRLHRYERELRGAERRDVSLGAPAPIVEEEAVADVAVFFGEKIHESRAKGASLQILV